MKRYAHLPLDSYTPEIVCDLIDGVIADGLRNGFLAVLTIADSASNAFLGSLVFFDITSDDAEIGYWVAPEHRGRKVSGQALTLALSIARALGFQHLRARTVRDNPASAKTLLNAGFEQLGEARAEVVPSGKTEISQNYKVDLRP